eukprot:3278465-Pleurochrysis_carterae.AAC.1
MPAAELFGAWAVAAAAAHAGGRGPRAVIAVGDYDPAAQALNAATSRTQQKRALLEGARALTSHWLAVSVPRGANTDADRLSHPTQLEEVLEGARQAGLRPHVVKIPVDAGRPCTGRCKRTRAPKERRQRSAGGDDRRNMGGGHAGGTGDR